MPFWSKGRRNGTHPPSPLSTTREKHCIVVGHRLRTEDTHWERTRKPRTNRIESKDTQGTDGNGGKVLRAAKKRDVKKSIGF